MFSKVTYAGTYSSMGNSEIHTYRENSMGKLYLHLNEVNHSPTGFSWGYNGSGCAQTAYEILRDFSFSLPWAKENYMKFKHDVISKFPMTEPFILTSEDIRGWMERNDVKKDWWKQEKDTGRP